MTRKKNKRKTKKKKKNFRSGNSKQKRNQLIARVERKQERINRVRQGIFYFQKNETVTRLNCERFFRESFFWDKLERWF